MTQVNPRLWQLPSQPTATPDHLLEITLAASVLRAKAQRLGQTSGRVRGVWACPDCGHGIALEQTIGTPGFRVIASRCECTKGAA